MSVTLPSLIASGMVLQRDAAVTLWGAADEPVTVSFLGRTYRAVPDGGGAWSVRPRRYGVPIGLVQTAIGGTPIHSWMSREALDAFPDLLEEAGRFAEDAHVARVQAENERNAAAFFAAVDASDPGPSAGWHLEPFDDSAWPERPLLAPWDGTGSVWQTIPPRHGKGGRQPKRRLAVFPRGPCHAACAGGCHPSKAYGAIQRHDRAFAPVCDKGRDLVSRRIGRPKPRAVCGEVHRDDPALAAGFWARVSVFVCGVGALGRGEELGPDPGAAMGGARPPEYGHGGVRGLG